MLHKSLAYKHRACSNMQSKTLADCKLATGLLSVVFPCIIYIFWQRIMDSSNSGKFHHPTGQVIHSTHTHTQNNNNNN